MFQGSTVMRVEWQSGVNFIGPIIKDKKFGLSVLFEAKDQIGRQYDSVDRIIAFKYVVEYA